eukprot:TRINITY_DN400_c0_g1_i6.p1 TRINITY_DN400_c0_g1~~TRINITY_DN400_c0_g1_i6.p1  ORF type:complete len:1562 (+),score=549.99 TRINITY_DN400_c0_g1_i6:451-4686(+)
MDEHEVGVSWCPEFHDLGLIAGILCPCYLGFPLYLMSPEHFLQRPARWVEMMSKYKGTFSGGPNFAYDLTARKTPQAVRDRLDLSRWRIAFCGAEPVKISTANSFKSAFPSFPRSTFYPGWGLAEATLIIANTLVGRTPSHMVLNAGALARHEVAEASDDDIRAGEYRSIVSQGVRWLDNDLRVIDPDTLAELPHNRVGELVVQGPTVGLGYWGKPDETEEAFGVVVQGLEGRGRYLRTGDLGFILPNGEVFICGRRKDVIIVAGVNHYPQDFEATAEACSAVLRKGCGAAFGVEDSQGAEQVVMLFEIDKQRAQGVDLAALAAEVSQTVAEKHGVTPAAVGLIPAQAVCKTTSGKIQRRATKAAYLTGEIEVLAEHRPSGVAPVRKPAAPAAAAAEAEEVDDDDILNFVTPPDSPASRALDHAAQVAVVSADAGSPSPPRRRTPSPPPSAPRPAAPVPPAAPPASPAAGSRAATPRQRLGTPTPIRLPTPVSSPAASPRPGGAGRYSQRDCAVVGIGCRLPGSVSSAEDLWAVLREGKCVVDKVPEGRWPAGHGASEHGAFLSDVRSFDHSFFGIAPEEAALMDPQQRLLLEVAQEALDDAGASAARMRYQGPVGCFVGVSQQEYARIVDDCGQTARSVELTGMVAPNDKSMVASRMAACLGFRGPTRSIDTACSSSLVAIHDAYSAIARRECHAAIAAGVNLMLTPDISAAFEQAGFLAADGRCKTFDASADGYVRGEGVCAVLLKPLDAAVADGDRVYAVLKGSAVNQDGKSNGLTAPNGAAQEAVIRAAFDAARVEPKQLQYIEAHGTGTALGDPIELKALQAVLGDGRLGADCRVGSAKTNFGHLESAAGILGFMKVALALHHRELPASLHYSSPNPHAPFADRALQKRRGAWPSMTRTLLAGVSSFGFGGTNAHAVLSEAPRRLRRPAQAPPTCNTCYCLPVSHPVGGQGLTAQREALVRSLSKCDDAKAVQLCAAAALRRAHHSARHCVVGFTREELLSALREAEPRQPGQCAPSAREASVGFVFSGQGPQWYGMGRRLLHKYPAFHERVKVIDGLFTAAQQELEERYPQVPRFGLMEQFLCEEEDSLLRHTYAAQPCVFALQVGLAALLKSFGIVPRAVVGHSLGELAAAVTSGAMPLEEAVRLVYIRACVMHKAAGLGRMAAVQLSYEEEEGELLAAGRAHGTVVIAARNTALSVTVSGEGPAVDKVVAEAKHRGLWVRPLPVDYAFHSPQMEPLAAELVRELKAAGGLGFPAFPECAIYSTAQRGAVNPPLDAAYWGAQVLNPVLFAEAVGKMRADGIDAFVEIAPHPVLKDSVAAAAKGATVQRTLHRECDEERSLKACAAALYEAGVDVHWEAVTGIKAGSCGFARLPRTAWQRSEHWVRDARVLYCDEEPGITDDWDD